MLLVKVISSHNCLCNCLFIEHLLKTPLKKWLGAPVQSCRKALGTVNKIVATPATSHKGDVLNKPLAAQVSCF